jgi:hypothetical protein
LETHRDEDPLEVGYWGVVFLVPLIRGKQEVLEVLSPL